MAINFKENDAVLQGDVLIILEAMKMEHSIKAPVDGVILAVHYKVGDQVDEAVQLIEFEEN